MRAHILVATPVEGPLTADQLTAILQSFRSVHQFQPFDQFSVVYISEHLVLQLDRGAMESIVDYLAVAEPNCRKTAFITRVAESLLVRPKPEPEVMAAIARAPEPEEEPPFDLLKPKFVARVRFKLRNGRRIEVTRAVDRLGELESVLEDGPYDEEIDSIKIKLEIQT
jgi:hypothetical protein